MVNSVLAIEIKKIWDAWNIRAVILISLSLQTILILFAPFRKRTANILIKSLIWSAYLLADWTANFGVGLIAENARDTSRLPKKNNGLVAFWAPFLLLHLGGPDTITSFSLEDNELWLRHLFGLIFQTVATVYIFVQSTPRNKLYFPTILMFIAGLIKYIERIRALYLASVEKFRESTLGEFVKHHLSRGVVIKKDGDYLEVGFQYFKLFKAILVDLYSSFENFNFQQHFFGQFSPEQAMGIIEVELNLVYQVLHTKIQVTHSLWGNVLRFICFGSVVAALSFFYFQVEKQSFNKFDVGVTYTLFLGAISLDIIAFLMLIFSDWTFVALRNDDNKFKNCIAATLRWFINLKEPRWHSNGSDKFEVLATPFLFRRWSGSVIGLSWIRFCVKACPSRVHKIKSGLYKIIHYLGVDRVIPSLAINGFRKIFQKIAIATNKVIDLLGLGDIVYEIRIKTSLSHKPLPKELWKFIFDELKRKAVRVRDPEAAINMVCSATGNCTLEELDKNGDVNYFMSNLSSRYAHFTLDRSVTLWHIATELIYYTSEEVSDENTYNAREFSKILSDYMLYLSQLKPALLNSTASFTKLRLHGSRDKANKFFQEKCSKPSLVKFACKEIMLEPSTYGKESSVFDLVVLYFAKDLANELQKLENNKKWELVSKVWVELLSYGASHCRPRAHAQQVTNGGELITFVWLLMLHFNIVKLIS